MVAWVIEQMPHQRIPHTEDWLYTVASDPVFAARYRLGRLLGRGAHGVVMLARDRLAAADRAIKFLCHGHDGNLVSRFAQEARILARIRHPNVVSVFDAGEVSGVRYLVTELIAGGSLANRIREGLRLTQREAIQLVVDALDALDACHRRGIVHRDLKPANILVTSRNRARLVDFGVARDLRNGSSFITTDGIIVGTPRYMSPEQARGECAGPAADIYAVGVILFELLTGRPLFRSASVLSLLRSIQTKNPPRLGDARPGVSVRLDAIVARALAREPSERFPTAAAMARQLRLELYGRGSSSRSTPRHRARESGRGCSRWNVNVAIAVLSIMGALLVGVLSLPGVRPCQTPGARVVGADLSVSVSGARHAPEEHRGPGLNDLAEELSRPDQILRPWGLSPPPEKGRVRCLEAPLIVADLGSVCAVAVQLAPGCRHLAVNGFEVGDAGSVPTGDGPLREGLNWVSADVPDGVTTIGRITLERRNASPGGALPEASARDARLLDEIGVILGNGQASAPSAARELVDRRLAGRDEPFRAATLARIALDERPERPDLFSRILEHSEFDPVWTEPWRLDRARASLALFQTVIGRDTHRWAAWQELGFILRKCGHASAARAALFRAITLWPGSHWTWRDLGLLVLSEVRGGTVPPKRVHRQLAAARRCLLAALRAHREAPHPIPWLELELSALVGERLARTTKRPRS